MTKSSERLLSVLFLQFFMAATNYEYKVKDNEITKIGLYISHILDQLLFVKLVTSIAPLYQHFFNELLPFSVRE